MKGNLPFKDVYAEDFPRPDVNPYVASHRTFGDEIIPASDAPARRGRWAAEFGRDAPLHVEIGSGNGFYLSGMARQHPEADWIGLEIRFKRVVLAATKLRAFGLRNARVVRYDALVLDDLVEAGTLAGIHVNHPDPWSRQSQRKHRMIDRRFAELAARLLAPGGSLRLKTDFHPHVDALLGSLEGLPLTVVGVVRDVARDGAPWPADVTTNYQRKAYERGAPVSACWVLRE